MNLLTILPLAVGALLGLYLSAGAVDTTIYLHGMLLTVFCIVGIFPVIKSNGNTGEPANPNSAIKYNDAVIRAGLIATTFWGVVGFLVGLVIASQLAFPVLNLDLPWPNSDLQASPVLPLDLITRKIPTMQNTVSSIPCRYIVVSTAPADR